MGSDHFAVLGQARRPWLDLEKLKKDYQQTALEEHPDRKSHGDTTTDFSAVNEAYRVLSNPKLRLQHLLSLETAAPADTNTVPAELMEPFMQTAALIRDADDLVQRLRAATNALSKSLLASDIAAVRDRIGLRLTDLQKSYDLAIEHLQQLDEVWDTKKAETIDQLASLSWHFAYLERWLEQLRERQFQLSN